MIKVTNKAKTDLTEGITDQDFLLKKKSLKYLILLTEYLHLRPYLTIVNVPSLKSIEQ